MFFEPNLETDFINSIINKFGNNSKFLNFLEFEINNFLSSKKRANMLLGERYYIGKHDILKKERTVIGSSGLPEQVANLPNNKIIDNQYARVVDQKNSYLLSKPITFYSRNKNFNNSLNSIFSKSFLKTMKNLGEDALNCGISWLYLFLDEDGNMDFKRFKPSEVLPIWADEEHTNLEMLLRIYDIEHIKNNRAYLVKQVELYTSDGIKYFIFDNSKLLPDNFNSFKPYIYNSENVPFSWSKIPIIPFKFNSKEIPLINRVKSLQDALNSVRSDFMNNMQEDTRNTILILKNYDGTNLSEFRKNLSEYGVVKVKTIDGCDGGVETLKINIDVDKYDILAKSLKKAIIENARGYDSKDDKMTLGANQMSIQSVYADIDLDASLMEMEFQASFHSLVKFVKQFLFHITEENYIDDDVDVIFNRDMLINETEAINNCLKSKGIISNETIISQHPWVSDTNFEIEQLSSLN